METISIEEAPSQLLKTDLQDIYVRKVRDDIIVSNESAGQQTYNGYEYVEVEVLQLAPLYPGEILRLSKAGLQYLVDNFESFEINDY